MPVLKHKVIFSSAQGSWTDYFEDDFSKVLLVFGVDLDELSKGLKRPVLCAWQQESSLLTNTFSGRLERKPSLLTPVFDCLGETWGGTF